MKSLPSYLVTSAQQSTTDTSNNTRSQESRLVKTGKQHICQNETREGLAWSFLEMDMSSKRRQMQLFWHFGPLCCLSWGLESSEDRHTVVTPPDPSGLCLAGTVSVTSSGKHFLFC